MNKRRTLLVALGATILWANTALAQRVGRERSPDRDEPGLSQHPLALALDTDRDGTISAAEIERAGVSLKALDRNGDGQLTPDETRARVERVAERGREAPTVVSLESAPLPKTESEKKILDVLDDLDRNQRRGMMNVPVADGRLLRLLAETIGAKHVVEIGTSNGYSGIWLCLALRTTGGKLTTYEIDAHRASLARQNFQRAGVNRIVTLVEGDAHENVTKLTEPIDLLFLDADKPGYVDYLEKLLPLVRPGGLVVAHNMRRPAPNPAYLQAITSNPELETLFLNMHAAGVGVTLKKR